MKTWSLASLWVVLLAAPAAAQFPTTDPNLHAPTSGTSGEAFGSKGQLVMSSDFRLDFSVDSVKPPIGASTSRTNLLIAPSLDWFLAKNLSLGGTVGFEYDKVTGRSTLGVLVAPAVGLYVPMTPRTGLFPKVAAGYTFVNVKADSPLGGSMSESGSLVTVVVSAPVLFHPVPHFFIGVGPRFAIDVVSKLGSNDGNKHTTFGIALQVGGWW